MQVTIVLEKLDSFMQQIEPEIDGITGEEKDTASFMKMMRLFNEVHVEFYSYCEPKNLAGVWCGHCPAICC